ncbi:hypothetical protein Hanom_Chr05g00400361 [Helianthus anomalus]
MCVCLPRKQHKGWVLSVKATPVPTFLVRFMEGRLGVNIRLVEGMVPTGNTQSTLRKLVSFNIIT